MGDRSVFYQRLGFAYEAFRRYLAEQQARGRGVHVVAEPDFPGDLGSDAPVDRAMAYLEYESICNDTYAPYGSSVTCLWDSRRHASHVIDGACSVHSHELTEAGRTLNPRYVVPEDYLAGRTDAPLQPPPAAVERDLQLIEAKQLGLLRAAFGSWVEQHGFDVSAVEDIVLAITEVATNGLAHGAAPVRVRGWQDGSALVVQVDDGGGRPVPPDAGYRRPAAAHTPGGRGLWLARQLADTVTARAETGQTSVRLHFPREVHQPKPAVTGGGRRWAGSPTDRPAAGRSRPGHDPDDEPFLELRDYGTLPGRAFSMVVGVPEVVAGNQRRHQRTATMITSTVKREPGEGRRRSREAVRTSRRPHRAACRDGSIGNVSAATGRRRWSAPEPRPGCGPSPSPPRLVNPAPGQECRRGGTGQR